MSKVIACLLLFVPLMLLAGWGSKNQMIEVKGNIKFANGKPLPEGSRLRFSPIDGGRKAASATVDADGSFTLTHATGGDGAEVGNYSVAVLPPSGKEIAFAKLVPDEYIDGDILSAEIKPGMSPLSFTVKPKRMRR